MLEYIVHITGMSDVLAQYTSQICEVLLLNNHVITFNNNLGLISRMGCLVLDESGSYQCCFSHDVVLVTPITFRIRIFRTCPI